MEEPQKEEKTKPVFNQKALWALLVAILVILAAVGLFRLTKGTPKPEASPTPGASPTAEAAPVQTPLTSTPTTAKSSPSPTPTPTPTPTFSVTGVTAAVSPTSYTGDCPKEFIFTANIAANGAGTVTYKWVRSDGAGGPTKSLVFGAAGTKAAEGDTWTLGGPGGSYTNWEKVQILTPNLTESNQATFTLKCST